MNEEKDETEDLTDDLEGQEKSLETQSETVEVKTTALKVEPTELPLKATVEDLSTEYAEAASHPNDVKFKVKYSKDFKGDRHFKEGDVQVVSKESAEHFTKLGMGAVVK